MGSVGISDEVGGAESSVPSLPRLGGAAKSRDRSRQPEGVSFSITLPSHWRQAAAQRSPQGRSQASQDASSRDGAANGTKASSSRRRLPSNWREKRIKEAHEQMSMRKQASMIPSVSRQSTQNGESIFYRQPPDALTAAYSQLSMTGQQPSRSGAGFALSLSSKSKDGMHVAPGLSSASASGASITQRESSISKLSYRHREPKSSTGLRLVSVSQRKSVKTVALDASGVKSQKSIGVPLPMLGAPVSRKGMSFKRAQSKPRPPPSYLKMFEAAEAAHEAALKYQRNAAAHKAAGQPSQAAKNQRGKPKDKKRLKRHMRLMVI